MQEIEVKILEVDKEEVIRKLKDFGAKEIFEGEIIAIYFDFEGQKLTKGGKLLRLRKMGEKVELTFKQMISREKAKIMEEYEVKLTEFDVIKKILNELGLKEFRKVIKHRVSYTLNNIHFELDTFPDIPAFLEIEAPSIEKIREFTHKLGFSIEDTRPWSIWDVLEYYGKK